MLPFPVSGFLGHLNEDAMLECLKVLLDHFDVNEKDGEGESPLSWAVYHQFESCALYLVKSGADTTVRLLITKVQPHKKIP